ncbi:glycerophosphodiester phosphodiesterase [Streptomyces sp. NPDC090306]|uniref:glycerophosphodiester phosphodiesterase n=1 Tax=unclassified Streptomyces TaxID=2593676 RepID=UPI0036E84001
MHARAVAAAATTLVGAAALLGAAGSPQASEYAGRPVVVAHRGGSSLGPENTLAAVDRAAELGFSWVENDVQRTRDGELVVVHDDTLARTTDVEQVFPDRAPWKVGDFTAAEIARLDAGSWFGAAYAGTRVPTLDQYADRVEENHQNLLLEIKNPELYPGIEQQILKTLGDRGWLDADHLADRLIVQSFSADSLCAVHDLEPSVTTGYLGTPAASDLPRYARCADLINPDHEHLTASYVSAVHAVDGAHGQPLRVFAWTVDDAARARTLAGFGVDGIITDRPDVVRDALTGS